MATSEQEPLSDTSEYYEEEEEEEEDDDSTESGNGSDDDPTFNIIKGTNAKLSNLSIRKKSISRITIDLEEEVVEEVVEVDEKSLETVQRIIEAGQLEKLKVDQCKIYLRNNKLRLTGNKETLIQRIREHQEILKEGEKRYPVSSFVLNCKGDACTGDVVMFEQNVYEMFSIASRSATGPSCGTRTIAGRIVKESYGAAKQQHTFTIEVLWSKGEKPLPPLHPLLIKGRNLYRLKTLRQRWVDEGERERIISEKHSRGSLARLDRDTRIQEKEKKKNLRGNRLLKKDALIKNQIPSSSSSSANITTTSNQAVSRPSSISGNLVNMQNRIQEARLPYFHTRHPDVVNHNQGNKYPLRESGNIDSNNYRTYYMNPDTQGVLSNPVFLGIYRPPLRNANHNQQMNLLQQPRSHVHKQRQVCRYYGQGRCHFGNNCKFLHESTNAAVQNRQEKPCANQRMFSTLP